MYKNVYINKILWEQIQQVFLIMKQDNAELTLNRALNKLMKQGVDIIVGDKETAEYGILNSFKDTISKP